MKDKGRVNLTDYGPIPVCRVTRMTILSKAQGLLEQTPGSGGRVVGGTK